MPLKRKEQKNKGDIYYVIKGRQALSIVAGVLFCALIAQTMSEKVPVNLVQANQEELSIINDRSTQEQILPTNILIQETPKVVVEDIRIQKVRAYLSRRGAPLSKYAKEMVNAADTYGIDYRLVAAISIIESNGGRYTFRPYNAWGWGKMTFANWNEGIEEVSEGLGHYYSRGLTTPKLISNYYCPPSASSWANKVQSVMNEIKNI